MWNKFTNFVKSRPNDLDNGDAVDEQQQPAGIQDVSNASAVTNGSVMSRVYEQHPNMSMFQSGSAVNLASSSPPPSPSKGSKRSMFKRSLKAKLTSTPVAQVNPAPEGDVLSPGSSVWTSPSPVKLIPKRLRASLQIDTFTAQTADTAPAPESAPLPIPHTPTFAEQNGDASNPATDSQLAGPGSIRSILRDRNTPGTGQSVRFFSRDAYRVISPNVSEVELDQEVITGMDPEAFLERLRSVSPENSANITDENATKYHSAPTSSPDNVVDMFSPPRQGLSGKSRKPLPFQPRHPPRTRNASNNSSHSGHSRSNSDSMSPSSSQSLSSLMMPVLPADMSNLFDVSQEHELAEIPVSVEGSLLDNAIEEVENENEGEGKLSSVGDASMKTIRRSGEPTAFPSVNGTPHRSASMGPPRSILSPEGAVFRSFTDTIRAKSRTPSRSFPGTTNDHTNATIFFTPEASQARIDNKTTYFTPEATSLTSPDPVMNNALMVPPSTDSPHALSQELVIHSHEDLVLSLRGQLELQQQLAAQFEVDLTARDELVSLLSTQLQEAATGAEKYKKEVERRQSAMRILRRKVGELEKICRGLEEEVERSREESFDRSIMDEASGGALVVLQSSIGQLKGELERAKEEEAKVKEERDALKTKVETLMDERGPRDEVEKELRDVVESKSAEIQELEERLSGISQTDSRDQERLADLETELADKERIIDEEREKLHQAESQWAEEKADLVARMEERFSDEDTRDANLADLQNKIREKEDEITVLKAEVEAQWGHAEKADEKIKGLEGEKEALSKSVQTLHGKVEELGAEWKEGEVKRAELEDELNDAWAAKDEIERERDQLVEDVNFEREHAEQLTQSLHEREAKLTELDQERKYAADNAARLEDLLRARDSENAEAQARIVEREEEAEQLRAQMHKMKREHSRFADDQGRTIDETLQREDASRRQMEDMVKQKAEDDVEIGSMKERLSLLTEEVERLRRQVHGLQQESADKDMKLLQLTKARAQDKEDKEGLNIALDSKQQELELLKRKLGVKGTGGSTPAPTRVGLPDLGARRQSVAFATPSAPRPRPAVVAHKATPSTDTPNKTRFGSSIQGNSVSNSTAPPSTVKSRLGSMGPPVTKRSSVSGTPLSASTSSLSRSTSSLRRSALPVGPHRRSSSAMSTASAVLSDDGEKENAPVKPARRTMVPA